MTGKQFPLSLVINAVDRATAPLNRLQHRIERMTAPARALSNSFASLNQVAGVPRLTASFSNLGEAIGGVGAAAMRSARRVGVLLGIAGGAAFVFQRQFIGTADTFERLELSLTAMEGSAEKAQKSMAFIKRLAKETPFDVQSVANAFRTMRNVGMDPVAGSLQAVLDQTAKVGGTAADLEGVAMAVSQMFSAQKVGGQDVLQLLNRQIPVWGLLQRAYERLHKGHTVTVKQLKKASEQGELGPEWVGHLVEQMGIESRGASKLMMSTWSGMVSNLSDTWEDFKLKVMDSGPMKLLKQQLADVLALLNRMGEDGRLQMWANRFGAVIVRVFKWLDQNGPRIWDQLVAGATTVFRWADRLATIVGGWGNLLTIGVVGYVTGPLIGAVAQLGIALAALNLSLAGTPVGLLLMGAGLAVAGVWAMSKHLPKEPDELLGGRPIKGMTDAFGNPIVSARELAAQDQGWLGELNKLRMPRSVKIGKLGKPEDLLPPTSAQFNSAVRPLLNQMIERGSTGHLDVNIKVSAPRGTTVHTRKAGDLDVNTRMSMGWLMPEVSQ